MCELVGRNLPQFGRNILSSRSGSYTRLYDVTLQQTVGLYVQQVKCKNNERKGRENYPRNKRVENILSKTPWPQSASELYRQSGRRRSAKLVPTFADRGVSRGQSNGSPRPLISVFWTGSSTFYSSSSSLDLTRLSGPRSRLTTIQKIWQRRESNPRPLYTPSLYLQKFTILLACAFFVNE